MRTLVRLLAVSLMRAGNGLPKLALDVGFWRSPKWAGATPNEVGTFVALVSYCYEHGTDGRIPRVSIASALGLDRRGVGPALRLLSRRGVVAFDDASVLIVGYLDHNPSASEIADYKRKRSDAGRTAANARHSANRMRIASGDDASTYANGTEQNRTVPSHVRDARSTTAYPPRPVDRCDDCGKLDVDCDCDPT